MVFVENELKKVSVSQQRAWMQVSHALAWNDFNQLEKGYRWLLRLELQTKLLNEMKKTETNKAVFELSKRSRPERKN